MHDPTAANLAFDPRLKTFASEFFNQWRRQKWSNNDDAVPWLQLAHLSMDVGKRFDATANHLAHVTTFEAI